MDGPRSGRMTWRIYLSILIYLINQFVTKLPMEKRSFRFLLRCCDSRSQLIKSFGRKGSLATSPPTGSCHEDRKAYSNNRRLPAHGYTPKRNFLTIPHISHHSLGDCMFAYSTVIRRQQFLINTLSGYNRCPNQLRKMTAEGSKGEGFSVQEPDAQSLLRRITPVMESSKHKGQAGKIAVIGGCREYTGAPYFAAISSLKIGADLSHVFCTKDAAPIIKSYSPELIVHPVLEESYNMKDTEETLIYDRVIDDVKKWIARFDCLVIGPGLGRDPFLLNCVSGIMKLARLANLPIIVDGDGLFHITNNIDLVSGYPLAVLTPNVIEYKRLVEKCLNSEVDSSVGPQQLLNLARFIGGVTIIQKGKSDFISDSEKVYLVTGSGSPRRCGGQGDILSGSVAVFSAWARRKTLALADEDNRTLSPMVLGSIAGSFLVRKAASLAFEKTKRATLTTNIIECLGESLENICPA